MIRGAVVAVLLLGCGQSFVADGGLDAGPDGGVDAGPPACIEYLREREARCGPLRCRSGFVAIDCPPIEACRDAALYEVRDIDHFVEECLGAIAAGDDCGSGCVAWEGDAPLCGAARPLDCPGDTVCTAPVCDASFIVGRCEPLPSTCEGVPPRIACGCDAIFHRDGCELELTGVRPGGFCNLFGLPCDPFPFEEIDCEDPVEEWHFDGERCVEGLACRDEVLLPREACERHRAECPAGPSGTLRTCTDDAECHPPYEMCLFPDDDPCGDGGSIGRCQVVPNGCFRRGVPPVCGCDGVTYDGPCAAMIARTRVRHPGPCE